MTRNLVVSLRGFVCIAVHFLVIVLYFFIAVLHLRQLFIQSTFIQWMTDRESKTLVMDCVASLFVLLRLQSTVECGLGRQLPGNQSQQWQSANHTSSPAGDGAACADDVIARLRQKAER